MKDKQGPRVALALLLLVGAITLGLDLSVLCLFLALKCLLIPGHYGTVLPDATDDFCQVVPFIFLLNFVRVLVGRWNLGNVDDTSVKADVDASRFTRKNDGMLVKMYDCCFAL